MAQVLASFEHQLRSIGSEKEQRNLVKELLAAVGGDQVKAVLNTVSRVPILNLAEPKVRAPRADHDSDEDVKWSSVLFQ